MPRFLLATLMILASGDREVAGSSPGPATSRSPLAGVFRLDRASHEPPARPGFHTVALNGHHFTLPVGFTIELAAAPPLADRPIVAAFDDRGRLYVCDSSGSNEPVKVQLEKKPHRVARLADTDGDGVFDKSTVFVPNVMLPEGAMWLSGSLYVAAPPHIWKFTDTDDDGRADKQEVWFDGKTLTGCANDLHGPYLGPDGWVYWCKGAFAKQDYTLPNGKPFTTRASHIFRAKPDGSHIEPVMTGGMDNPVDVVFTPTGDRIFSTTFLQHPGGGKRDGLIHAVYGGVYGKDHDPIYEHPWTSSQVMPVLTHLGPAAPCGLHRYESDQFGPEYADNVFCCQFNLRTVSRHVLVPSGSTYITKDSDFVVSDNLDFHPTDVIEDADGSLLVIDTGGWYKLCCPTSQLVKPDVTGAIYRVRKTDSHYVPDAWGLKLAWGKFTSAELSKLLDDPRPVVRARAVEPLAAIALNKGPWWFLEHLERASTRRAARGAVWVLNRIGTEDARGWLRDTAQAYPDTSVRLAAIHSLSLLRDDVATETLMDILMRLPLLARQPVTPAIKRAAAEALGRIGDKRAVLFLLQRLADETNDRVLDHSLTFALIEIGDPVGTAAGLTDKSPRVRRAALTALDQMPNGKLDPTAVIAELDAADAALRDTAWWIAGRHPEWGDRLVGYFRTRLAGVDALTPAAREELAERLVRFVGTAGVQALLADAVRGGSKPTKLLALRVMARSGLKAMPAGWAAAMAAGLDPTDDELFRSVLAVFRAVPATAAEYHLLTARLAGRPNPSDDVRLGVLAAAPPRAPLPDPDFRFTVSKLHKEQPPATRAVAADVLLRAGLAAAQLSDTAVSLKTTGPLEVAKLLPAFARSADEAVGLALVAALSDPAVRGVIRVEQVKPILDKYPKPVRDEAEKLYALLAEARKDERARLDQIAAELPPGDVRRGQVVFNGAKAQCAACHKIGYVGGTVGPDLTRVGGTRSDRDLLEAVVFPSASFVRSYEPVRVTTTDGRAFNGILTKDAPDELIVVVAADREERVARADVEDVSPGAVSVMPAGLDQQLTRAELADLVAFLKACR